MAPPLESRRGFVARTAGVGLFGGLAGCTAVGTAGAELVVENTGTREERTEYYVDRGGTTTETRTIELDAGDEHATSVGMGRGDAIVVSKGELGYEFELAAYVCRDPIARVDTGFGALAVSGECFDVRPL